VTAFALDLFLSLDTDSALALELKKENVRKAVLDGTEREDKLTFGRMWNWHFYPQNEFLTRLTWTTMRRTSRPIVKKRQEQLLGVGEGKAAGDLFETFGRVLHHVQDMNTPTHVVPIYHLADPFEEYLVAHCPSIFDGLKSDASHIVAAQGAEQDHDFCSLYAKAAEGTLDDLTDNGRLFPLPVNPELTVSSIKFWEPYKRTKGWASFREIITYTGKGFGKYGPLGKSFGGESCSLEGRTVPIDPLAFNRVAVFFVKRAIVYTLKALHLLSSLYADWREEESKSRHEKRAGNPP